jgi:hypothetical protein
VNKTPQKWHYTTAEKFIQIARDGVIKPSPAYSPASERPIVWFSSNQEWERTANKSVLNPDGTVAGDMMTTLKSGGGLVRIGVSPETAPYDWWTLTTLSGMSVRTAQILYRAAIETGARAGDWWGTFDPVPRSRWTAVHVYQKGHWAAGRVAE